MYRCSWLQNNRQCENTTNNLVCSECEEEKSRLYHEYKDAEKTVISAINDALPRGDLLEASKVVGRITRVVKLRRKFTSRLVPQSRDIGHEYHISLLLQKMIEYQKYILNIVSATTNPDDEKEDETEYNKTYEVHVQIATDIRNVFERDPFAEFDEIIKQYKKHHELYLICLAGLEGMLGYKGKDLWMLASLILRFSQFLTHITRSLTYLLKGYAFVSWYYPARCRDLNMDHPETALQFIRVVVEAYVHVDTNLIRWIMTRTKNRIYIKSKIISVGDRPEVIIVFVAGKIPYDRAYKFELRKSKTTDKTEPHISDIDLTDEIRGFAINKQSNLMRM